MEVPLVKNVHVVLKPMLIELAVITVLLEASPLMEVNVKHALMELTPLIMDLANVSLAVLVLK